MAAIVVTALTGWWLWHGSGDGPAFELCLRIKSELVQRREQGQISGPEWDAFRQTNEARLKALVKSLKDSVDARQPQRQALLWAARDELLVMLSRAEHRQRDLSQSARALEQSFDQHMQIATGKLAWDACLAKADNRVPTNGQPTTDATNISTIAFPSR